MSMETYDSITGTAETDLALAESEAEMAGRAELRDAKDVLQAARRKHIG